MVFLLDSSDPSVTITLDLFTVSLLLAGLLYGFTLVLAKRKYAFLRRANPSFDLKKLLVLSAGTACFLRIMSFVGVIAMDIANVRAHYSLNPTSSSPNEDGGQPVDRNQSFYDSSMTVIFVGGGKSKQLVIVRNVVNVAMSAVNLTAVGLVFLLYLYLSVSFSGFPFRSQNSKESLRKISNVMAFWSVGRIIWGIAMLIIYIQDVDLLRPGGSGWSPILFFLLLVFCEIAPIIVLCDYSFMTLFEFSDAATREMSSLTSRASGRSMREGDNSVPFGGDESFRESTEPLLEPS
ncbi:hypothetical protein ACHAWF_006574 [Thalassiosira exigua]